MKARVRAITTARRADESRIESDDKTEGSLSGVKIIVPPFRPDQLTRMIELSNTLRQCIDAYVTNIASYGFRVVPVAPGVEPDPEEQQFLSDFVDYANTEESLTSVFAKAVYDYEAYGYAYYEVIYDAKDRASLVRHVNAPALKKVAPTEEDLVTVTKTIGRGGRRNSIKERRRFCRYIQEVNGEKRFFKEFGDPRDLNYRTGEYAAPGRRVPLADRATAIIHEKQYAQNAYGSPRWVAHVANILGSRRAEEVNLQYFEDNTVPPCMLLVSGGRLTDESFRLIQEQFQKSAAAKDRQFKMMVVEAIAESDGIDDRGSVRLDLEKLASERQSDGLFKEYDLANQDKLASVFRLPNVLIGRDQNVNFAAAKVSVFVAETQVFLPERRKHDEVLNKMLVNHPLGLGLRTVKLESKGPTLTDPEQVIKALTALNVMGAVSPRDAVEVANETMQVGLSEYPQEGEPGWEEWMDKPIALALKNSRSRNTQNEQQQKTEQIKNIENTGDMNTVPDPRSNEAQN